MRVFHGPINIGGIGRHVSDYLRQHGIVSDFITYRDHTRRYNHHINLQLDTLPRWQQYIAEVMFKPLFLLFCLWRYSHFNFYFGVTFFRRNLDLPILKLFGKKIVMTYCGSDIRLMHIERERNPYWQLINSISNRPELDAKKLERMKFHNRWVDRFIVVRNLIDSAAIAIPKEKMITNIWVQNAFSNLDELLQQPIHFNTVPVIVHAPSNPGVKGTQYVEAAIAELRSEGHNFEYCKVTGIPNVEAQRLYQKCDIIVDQLLIGGFGSLSVEGMALGKPVCCYLIEAVKEQYFPDCPIVNSTVENLTSNLRWLIENPEERERIGLLGREFVRKHIDTEAIFQSLLEVYRDL